MLVALLVAATGTTVAVAAPRTTSRPAVVTVLPAPTGLKAVRNSANPNDFVISWNPITDPALHHYNVSVFQNNTDNVTVVPAGTNSLAVTGVNLSTTYRITVGSRDVNGEGTTTGYYWLYPVLPGSVLGLSAQRNLTDPTLGSVAWNPPTRPGYGPITQYDLTVTRMVDSVVVMKQSSLETTASLAALDPARSYSVKVTATNAYGVGVNETRMMYGVPGRRLQFWLQWRDPWPHEIDKFDEMKVSLYGLFDRSNLLDFIRHFIVFVTKDGKTEKVVVRYQQYLAVKDIVNRATGWPGDSSPADRATFSDAGHADYRRLRQQSGADTAVSETTR